MAVSQSKEVGGGRADDEMDVMGEEGTWGEEDVMEERVSWSRGGRCHGGGEEGGGIMEGRRGG